MLNKSVGYKWHNCFSRVGAGKEHSPLQIGSLGRSTKLGQSELEKYRPESKLFASTNQTV